MMQLPLLLLMSLMGGQCWRRGKTPIGDVAGDNIAFVAAAAVGGMLTKGLQGQKCQRRGSVLMIGQGLGQRVHRQNGAAVAFITTRSAIAVNMPVAVPLLLMVSPVRPIACAGGGKQRRQFRQLPMAPSSR